MAAAWALFLAGLVGTVAASPREAFERYRGSVVAVSYFVETSIMREIREVGGRDLGLVVAPDLVLINGSVVTASTTGAQPHSFKLRFHGGEEREATFVGRDEFANVAFLRVAGGLPRGVEPVRFDMSARLRVGDPVYAIGLLPENMEPMVRLETGTIVAAVDRPKPFFLTDLPPLSAIGGPVFTEQGRLVGVLSELGSMGPTFTQGFESEEGEGLVLDAATLAPLVGKPPVRGETRRAWLGITLQALDPDMAAYWGLGDASGVVLNSIVPGSPAEGAGLREGDIILTLDGQPVPVRREEHVPLFVEQIGSRPVGSNLQLGYMRGTERMETTVQLMAAPKSRLEAVSYVNETFDVSVRELVYQDYRAFDLEPEFRGVLVTKVEEGGWAGVGGLEGGDLVQKIDDHAIGSPDDLKQVLEAATEAKQRKLVFFVQRQGRTQFITVQPDWDGQP